jgi:predicted phosphodiesterase
MFLFVGCSKEDSPWDDNVKESHLTQRHLDLLDHSSTSPLRLKITGDTQAETGFLRPILNIDNNVDFTVLLGDITDLGFKKEWIWIENILSEGKQPVLTVVGNHDGLSKGQKIYNKLFGEFNYSFIYKNYKFVMWNNNFLEWNAIDIEWLRNEVETSNHKVVVMSHQPPGSDTLPVEIDREWKEIRKHPRYILSLHGHNHKFAFYYESETKKPIYVVSRVTDEQYGILTLNNSSFSIENCKGYVCSKIK